MDPGAFVNVVTVPAPEPSSLGLLTTGFLIRHSRIAIVIIFVIAAILTPPDVFSQMILALPLLLLYGLSIVVVHFAGRKK